MIFLFAKSLGEFWVTCFSKVAELRSLLGSKDSPCQRQKCADLVTMSVGSRGPEGVCRDAFKPGSTWDEGLHGFWVAQGESTAGLLFPTLSNMAAEEWLWHTGALQESCTLRERIFAPLPVVVQNHASLMPSSFTLTKEAGAIFNILANIE